MCEYFGCAELRSLWYPLPENSGPYSDPCGSMAEVANIILDRQNVLPVPVRKTASKTYTESEVKIACLESDDLQGFKPLAPTRIGNAWYHSVKASRNLSEDCVRLAVIKDALELHSRGDSKLISLQKDKKYAPVSEAETRKAQSESDELVIRYCVPDTNCWIERLPLLNRIIESDRYQIEVLCSLQVKHELQGLTKSDKCQKDAEKALEIIEMKEIRALTSKGAIMSANKNYGEVQGERKRNDDIIKDSAAALPGAVLLTDDRNLTVKARAENVAVDSLKSFRNFLDGRS